MPMPRFMAAINKRGFNKLAIRRRMYTVLVHTGRKSGKSYRTPLEALPVDGGYVIFIIYTDKSDWLKNVLAAGSAQLELKDGKVVSLTNPRVIPATEAMTLLPSTDGTPPGVLNVTEALRLDLTN